MSKPRSTRRRSLLVGGALVAVALLFAGLGGPLWEPPTSREPWIEALVARLASTVVGLRAAHAALALLGVGAVLAMSRRWLAGALLLASPLVVLAGRSAAGGIAALAPVALATGALVQLVEEPRWRAAAIALVGIVLGVGGVGVPGAIAPVAATLVLGAWERRGAELPFAWLATLVVAVVGALAGVALAAAAGGRVWPGPIADARSFDTGLGAVALGVFPIALLLPACFAAGFATPRRRALLAHAVAWTIPAALWPGDPWLLVAPAAPLAFLAADTLADGGEGSAALAVVAATLALLVARSFDLEPARLVGAAIPDAVSTIGDAAPPFGVAGWLLLLVAGGAFAGGRRTIVAGVVASLALTAWTAFVATPEVARRLSTSSLAAMADAFEVPIVAGLGVDPRERDLRSLAAIDDAIALLAREACESVIVPRAQLAPIERARRGRYVVIDTTAELAVATACPRLRGMPDANPLRDVLLGAPPARRIGHPADATWGNAIRLRAIAMPDRVVHGVAELPVTLVFEVLAPLEDGYRVVVRADGCDRHTSAPHELAGGALTTGALRPGDVVVDRTQLSLEELPACTYRVGIGFAKKAKLLPRTPPDPRDETERAIAHQFELR